MTSIVRWYPALGCLVVAVLMVLGLQTAHAQPSENLFASHGPGERQSWQPHGQVDVGVGEGGEAIRIAAAEPNDIRHGVLIPLRKGNYYRFSALVRTQGVSGPIGANLSIYGTYNHTGGLTGNTDWTLVEEVFRATADGPQPFALRLGYWNASSRGEAWFKAVRVEELPAWHGPYQPIAISAPQSPASTLPLRMLFFALAVPFTLFCLVWARNDILQDPPSLQGTASVGRRSLPLIALLGAALLVRLAAALSGEPSAEIVTLKNLALHLAGGFKHFPAVFQDGFPAGAPISYGYVLAAVGSFIRALNYETAIIFTFLLKSPLIVADLILIGFLFFWLRRRGFSKGAWVSAGLLAFNPSLVMVSAFWGQPVSMQACLCLAAVLTLLDRRLILSGILLGLAASTDLFYLLLVVLFIAVTMRLTSWKLAARVAYAWAATFLLLILPLMAGGAVFSPLQPGSVSPPAFNLWAAFGWVGQPLPALLQFAAAIGGIAICALAVWRFAPKKTMAHTEQEHRTLLLFLIVAQALFLALPGMQAAHLLSAMLFSAALASRSVHFRWMFLGLNLLLLFNLGHVFWHHDYLGQSGPGFSWAIALTAGLLLLHLILLLQRRFLAHGKGRKRDTDTSRHREAPTVHQEPFPIRIWDIFAVTLTTVIYLGVLLHHLGERDFPTSGITVQGDSAGYELDFGAPHVLTKAVFFGGEIAPEIRFLKQQGDRWVPLWSRRDGLLYYFTRQDYRKTYKNAEREFPPVSAEKLRILIYGDGATVNEIGLFDEKGETVTPLRIVARSGETYAGATHPLFDEPHKTHLVGSYRTRTYWDEVFYARSAFNLVQNEIPYERTHPPFGKTLIGLGIKAFDMTPFGWRIVCAGAIALLPALLFVGGRLLTATRLGAYSAMLLMAAEGMTFTLGRMANIDGFLVLFETALLIVLLRWYRAYEKNPHSTHWRWLALAGTCFGLALSIKWSALFLGFAIFLLVAVWKLSRLWRVFHRGETLWVGRPLAAGIARDAAAWLFWFAIFPLGIYYFSHADFLQSLPQRPSVLSTQGVSAFWEQQQFILDFHGGRKAQDSHSLAAPFYTWPLLLKPVQGIFFDGNMPEGMRSAISMMGNPVIWWLGLVAMLGLGWQALRGKDPGAIMLAAVYFLQFTPWILVQRPTFIYAYAPFLPLLILGLASVIARPWVREPGRRVCAVLLLLTAAAAFFLFYPAISGLPVAQDYFQWLRWFPSWSKI